MHRKLLTELNQQLMLPWIYCELALEVDGCDMNIVCTKFSISISISALVPKGLVFKGICVTS